MRCFLISLFSYPLTCCRSHKTTSFVHSNHPLSGWQAQSELAVAPSVPAEVGWARVWVQCLTSSPRPVQGRGCAPSLKTWAHPLPCQCSSTWLNCGTKVPTPWYWFTNAQSQRLCKDTYLTWVAQTAACSGSKTAGDWGGRRRCLGQITVCVHCYLCSFPCHWQLSKAGHQAGQFTA